MFSVLWKLMGLEQDKRTAIKFGDGIAGTNATTLKEYSGMGKILTKLV
jgi:hypothetical protein